MNFKKPKKLKFKELTSKSSDKSKGSASAVDRVNRTVYITVATLFVILVVAIAATGVANRARKDKFQGDDTTATPSGTTEQTGEVTVAPTPDTDAPTPPTSGDVGGADTDAAAPLPEFILPVSGTLGKRHDPTIQVFSNSLGEWRVHLGIDILSSDGANVVAAADGVISDISDHPLMGKSVTVTHAGGAVTVYSNLDHELNEGIDVGTRIAAGQVIGCIGESAMIEIGEEPHLHFEVFVDGEGVDPLDYLSPEALSVLANDKVYEG